MPELPRYQDKNTLPDAKPVQAKIDPKTASSVARAGADLAGKASAGIEQFAKLEMANQNSEAKIKTAEGVAKLNEDIQNDPEAWDSIKVQDRLSEIENEASEGISYVQGQNDFKETFGIARVTAQVQADHALRGYQITKNKAYEKVQKEYIGTVTDPKNREILLDEMLQDSVKAGTRIQGEVEAAKKEYQDDYLISDAVSLAQAGKVAEASKLVGSITDPVKKQQAAESLKAAAKYGQLKADAEREETYTKTNEEISDVVNNPDAPFIDKLQAIEDAFTEGKIDKAIKDQQIANLRAVEPDKTMANTASVVVAGEMIEMLDGKKPDKEDLESTRTYMRTVREVSNELDKMKNSGELTSDQWKTLQAKRRAVVNKGGKKQLATLILASDGNNSWFTRQSDRKTYEEFGDTVGLAHKDDAFLEYFYWKDGDPEVTRSNYELKQARDAITKKFQAQAIKDVSTVNVASSLAVLDKDEAWLDKQIENLPGVTKYSKDYARRLVLQTATNSPKGREQKQKYYETHGKNPLSKATE